MTTLLHTPGPWAYAISDYRDSEFEIVADSTIGTVERWDGDNDADLMEQAEANARLIAEAPMLLDAILDIKRLASKAADDEAFEFYYLEQIADRVQVALRFINQRSAL